MNLESVVMNPLVRRAVGPRRSLKAIRRIAPGISANSRIAPNARLHNPANIFVGEGSVIGYRCELAAWDRIEIGKNVILSSHSALLTGSHDVQDEEYGTIMKPVVLEDYVWIAYRCIVLPGVTMGYGSVAGAGSVVTKDVEPWSIVAGNPARHIKWRPRRELTYVPTSWGER